MSASNVFRRLMTKAFRGGKTAPIRKAPAARFGRIEELEDRSVPATVALTAGNLLIAFNAANESVAVANDGTNVTVTGSATLTTSFGTSAVTQITATDAGALAGQSLTFLTGTAFTLAGGLSSTGVETVTVNNAVAAPGAANISVTAPQNIVVAAALSGATVTLTADTGAQVTGSFVGVDLAANVTATGTLTVAGRGGDGAGGSQYGVQVRSGATVQGGSGTGDKTVVTGRGGDGTGASNGGVFLNAGTITSSGGNVRVTGTAGIGSQNLAGVTVLSNSIITSGTGGGVFVMGTGAAGTGRANRGVVVTGTGGTITAAAGSDVSVTGFGGSSSGVFGDNVGVWVTNNGRIQSAGTGGVSVAGTGGTGSAGGNYGVLVARNVASGGVTSGGVTSANGLSVTGTAGGATPEGVLVSSAGATTVSVLTATGAAALTGLSGSAVVVDDPSTANFGSLTVSTTGSATVFEDSGTVLAGGSSVGGTFALTSAGTITQTGTVGGGTLATSSVGGTTLTNSNTVSTFNATNATSGNIALTNTAGPLTVTGISEVAGGAVTITNTGGVTFPNALNGGYGLTVNSTGGVAFQAAVGGTTALASLAVPSAVDVTLGSVAVTGDVTVGTLTGPFDAPTAASTVTGAIAVTVGSTVQSGTAGRVLLAATRNVLLDTAATGTITVTGGGGGVTISANRQATPTAGSFSGVVLNGALVSATGAGAVSVAGTGGTGSGGSQAGVVILVSSLTSGSGDVRVTGTGGASTGDLNTGVAVAASAEVSSTGGSVTLTGTGGGAGGSLNNDGVIVDLGSTVSTASSSAVLTINGSKGANSTTGIRVSANILRPFFATTAISSGGLATLNGNTSDVIVESAASVNFGSLTVTTTGSATVFEDSGTVLAGGSSVGGTFALTSTGTITQTGTVSATGLATFNAGTNDITLTDTGNDFTDVNVTGGSVSLTENSGFNITGANVGTGLTLSSTAGITQSGAITGAGGLTQAGTGTTALSIPGNNYSGGTTVSAGTVLVSNTTGSGTGSGPVAVNGGTLGGTGSIGGAVTVNSGGSINPGNGGTSVGTLTVGGLTFNGGTYRADVLNNASDTITTAGAVNLNGGTRGTFAVNSVTGTPAPATVLTLINNTAAGAVTNPPLTGAAEGATVTSGALSAVASYLGGSGGNDFTLTVTGAVTYALPAAGSYTYQQETIGGQNYLRLYQGTVSPANLLDSRLSATVTSAAFTGTAGADTLTLDYTASGGYFQKDVTFNGGAGADTLNVTGGTFARTVYNYGAVPGTLGGFDGNIQNFNGSGTLLNTITYTSLSPIVNTGTATDLVFNLPTGVTNAATLQSSGGTGTPLRLSGGTFEQTDFANPTGSVTVNRGSAADTLTVAAVPALTSGLTIGSAANRFQAVSVSGAVALGASSDLAAYATRIATTAAVSARNITLDADTGSQLTGNFIGVDISANVTATGTLTVTGRGGDFVNTQFGVQVRNGAVVRGGSGPGVTTNITGTGGVTGLQNYGVYVFGSGSAITSGGGGVTVQGTGTGTGAGNHGVLVASGGQVSAGGAGKVGVTGFGGAGTNSSGAFVSGTNSAITSGGGAVSVTGTRGAATAEGILVSEGGSISTPAPGANITLLSTGDTNLGGPVTVTGTGNIGITTTAGGDLIVSAAVSTTTGTISGTVARDVTINSGGSLAASGTISVTNQRNLSVGGTVASSGGATTLTFGQDGGGRTATFNAAVTGTTAALIGGTGNDTVTVNAMGATNLTLNGGGGADQVFINTGTTAGLPGSGGAGAVFLTDVVAGQSYTATVRGATAGGDTFDVNDVNQPAGAPASGPGGVPVTPVPAITTGSGPAAVAVNGTKTLDYLGTNGLSAVNLVATAGTNTHNVQFVDPATTNSKLPPVVNIQTATTTDTANLYGTAGTDTIDIGFTTAGTATSGNRSVTYPQSTAARLAVLNVYGRNEANTVGNVPAVGDTFRVAPDTFTPVNILAGLPTDGYGDTLILSAFGLANPVVSPIGGAPNALPNGQLTSSNRGTITWNSIETLPVPLGLGGTFDFQPAAAPTQFGFLPVLPTDTPTSGAYSAAAVGWLNPGAGAVDRLTQLGPAALPNSPGLSTLLRTIEWGYAGGGANNGRFQVTVAPNQPVQVTAYLGDTFAGRDNMNVYVGTPANPLATKLNPSLSTFNSLTSDFQYVSYSGVFDPGAATLGTSAVLVVTVETQFGGASSFWTIGGLDVRPLGLIAPLVLSTAAVAPREADGLTVDTYAGTGATPFATLTVAPQNGTPVGTDADPAVKGFQVRADARGNFTFDLRRGTGSGPDLLTVTDVTGAAGVGAVGPTAAGPLAVSPNPFLLPNPYAESYTLPAARRIDFGPTGSPAAAGYVPLANGAYASPAANALGWLGTAPVPFDRGPAAGALLRDGVAGTPATPGDFVLDVPNANAVYSVTAALGDAQNPQSGMFVQVLDPTTGSVLATPVSGLNTPAGQTSSQTFAVTSDANGKIRLRFGVVIGPANPFWTLQSLEVRPVVGSGLPAAQAAVTLNGTAYAGTAPGTNLPLPATALPAAVTADGATATVYTITGVPAGAVLTVSTTLGTLLTADGSAAYTGAQVMANGSGVATFTLRAPLSTAAASGTITIADVTGAAVGVFTQGYTGFTPPAPPTSPPAAVVQRFDFNSGASPTLAGFTGVPSATGYDPSLGYGWVTAVSGYDRGSAPSAPAALFQDGAWGYGTGTFRLFVGANAQRDVRVYVGDPFQAWGGITVRAGVTNNTVAVDPVASRFGFVTLYGATADANGFLDVTIGGPIWVASGLEVATPGGLPAPATGVATAVTAAGRRLEFADTAISGYTAVPNTTVYSPALGYGWSAPVGSFARPEMFPASSPLNATQKQFYGSGAWGQGSSTFVIAVPLGSPAATYNMQVYVSDPYADWSGITLAGEGVAAVTTSASSNPPQAVTLTGLRDVNGDGAITLTVSGSVWVLNGLDVMNGTLPAAPQLAAASGGPGADVAPALTAAELTPVVSAAVARWEAAGITADQAARLRAVTFSIGDLSGYGALGLAPVGGSMVTLDATAAGLGWFVDPTPLADEEFALSGSFGPTVGATGAVGRYDLLTVVAHELGHVLGLDTLDAGERPDDLMARYLGTGSRRLPARSAPPVVTADPLGTGAAVTTAAPMIDVVPAPATAALADVREPRAVASQPTWLAPVALAPTRTRDGLPGNEFGIRLD